MLFAASFRFHFTLNDFLAPAKRNVWLKYTFSDYPSIKDAIEAMGVPHPEVDVIIVNGRAVNFTYKLQPDDQVEVYPANTVTIGPESVKLIPKTNVPYRFVLDVHLGKLARLLRMLGFDTVFDASLTAKQLASIAEAEDRILLTRGVELLKVKTIQYGYWLRSQHPEVQLQEVVRYYNLAPEFKLFSRCMVCNGEIEAVTKEEIQEKLPPKTRLYFNEFYQCSNCQRVYWKGSHYERMKEFITKLSQPDINA